MEKLNNQEEYKRPIPESIRKRKYGDNEIKTINVETKTLTSCWRSKEDIYKYLTEQKQVFLPSKRGCTVGIIRQKIQHFYDSFFERYFGRLEAIFLSTGNQLSVKNLFPKFQNNEKVQKYLPDFEEDQLPERSFFFGIIGTLHPEWLKKVIDQSLKHRNTKTNDEEKGQFVVVTEKIFNDLKQENFISKKPGKGIYLLQKKILQRKMFKSRQKFALAANPEDLMIPSSSQRKHLSTTQINAENANQSISNISIRNQETDDDMVT